MKKYTKEDLDQVLASYGLPAVENFEMIDSSQGDGTSGTTISWTKSTSCGSTPRRCSRNNDCGS